MIILVYYYQLLYITEQLNEVEQNPKIMTLKEHEKETIRLRKLCDYWLSKQDLKNNFDGFEHASAEFTKAIKAYKRAIYARERAFQKFIS